MRYRKDKNRRPTGLKLFLLVLCIGLIYAAVLLGIHIVGNRLEKTEPIPETVGSLEGRFSDAGATYQYNGKSLRYRRSALTNVLFIGLNWGKADFGDVPQQSGDQADFLMLMSFDKKNKTISTVHIDRDTVTEVRSDDGGAETGQICRAYFYGDTRRKRVSNTAQAVSKLMGGIRIDACLVMDTDGINALNDALGGIEVEIEDDLSALDPSMVPGAKLTLQDGRAEIFVCGETGTGPEADASRMKRQREFMERAVELTIRNTREKDSISALYDAVSKHLYTDVTNKWLLQGAYEWRKYDLKDMTALEGVWQSGSDGLTEFRVDQDALGRLLAEVYFEPQEDR